MDQNWGNTATTVVQARIPAGTSIFIGPAAPHRGLVGGTTQVYIPKVDSSWIKMMGNFYDEEIHGFQSLSEYNKFVLYVEKLLMEGVLTEIPSDKAYQKGMIYGGRWFRVPLSGDVWRLVEPDFPFRGVWERVEKIQP